MKSTRKHILALCVFALGFAAPVIHAEENEPPRPEKTQRPEGRDPMKERLGLTDEQVQQMKAIRTEEREQMKALRDKELPPKERRDEMRKIREASRAKMDAVLTEEQKAKRDAARKNRQGPGPKREKGPVEDKGPKGPPPADDVETE